MIGAKLTEQERIFFIGWLSGTLEYITYSALRQRTPKDFKKELLDAILQSIAQGTITQKEEHELLNNVKIDILLHQALKTGTLKEKMGKWLVR